jgi:glutamate-5-semialdehyde dehydrogenase
VEKLAEGGLEDDGRAAASAGVLESLALPARVAARKLAILGSTIKDDALRSWADALQDRASEILEANGLDVEADMAEVAPPALIDRLKLDEGRIGQMAEGLRQLVGQKDPVGTLIEGWTLPNGLRVEKVRVPLGVIGVIYEGRPNVTVDAAGLAIKAGSAVLLRGSRVAEHSNGALVRILQEAGEAVGLPAGAVQAVPPTRDSAREMMRARGMIDLLIPRGGNELIQAVVRESQVPVIETGVGNCHVYIDARADLDKALRILVNAKVQRPGVCNAAETFLVHRAVADAFVPKALAAMEEHRVEVFGDEEIGRFGFEAGIVVKPATDDEYRAEFLDLKIAARVVGSVEDAIEHINTFGSQHTECIVTEDQGAATRFIEGVDAAAVMVNASTRFTDGAELGMGAEIGISTQKLHARGPMALPELTTYKFVIYGTGQVRD